MGMSLATGVYSADLTRSSFAMVIDYGATAHSYAEAWITRWALRGGSSTMPISLELHIVATAETDAGASPAMTEGDMDFIYPYPGTLLNIASTAYEADRFTLVCDRKLIFDFNNSVYITGVGLGKRTTMLATSVPYLAANKSVYWSNKRNVSGVNVELILSNSYDTVTINMPLARLNAKGPDLLSVEESTRLPLTWEARRRVDPAVDALTVTIAAVP